MNGRIDLNLLQALDALLKDRNVTAAAQRVGIGQPAMSAALSRLRVLFDDPLFIRTPKGMEPTPRALAVAEPLQIALAQLRSITEPIDEFDPSTARQTFRVSGGDYAAMVLLPQLLHRLEQDAPGIDVRFRFMEKGSVLGCIDEDVIDLALCVLGSVPKRFASEILLTDDLVCVVGAHHELAESALTVERFCRERHILVTERGDEIGAVDKELAELGLSRRIVLTVPQVSLIPMLLAESKSIATIARCAAKCLTRISAIQLIELPIPSTAWKMDMVWSSRRMNDASLGWLRSVLKAIATDQMAMHGLRQPRETSLSEASL